jgi:hypothetical protein
MIWLNVFFLVVASVLLIGIARTRIRTRAALIRIVGLSAVQRSLDERLLARQELSNVGAMRMYRAIGRELANVPNPETGKYGTY